jgi:hypothetical protein
MKKLIIAANLGHVRVLKFRAAGEDPVEQEHLVEVPEESTKVHVEAIHETVTDQSGRFGRGTPPGYQTGMSYGEDHHLQDEMERVALKRIVARIEGVLAAENHPAWILAAPASILGKLEKNLPVPARASLALSTAADLTRCPLSEMEHRFTHH